MNANAQTYPLSWPPGVPRTAKPKDSAFSTRLDTARVGLCEELRLLGATDVVISSNERWTREGIPAVRQPELDADPGVAVWFKLHGEQRVIPSDRWLRLADNIQAVRLAIAAMRGLDRWLSHQMVTAAFAGFAALPAGSSPDAVPWYEVLGLPPNASAELIKAAYKIRAKTLHPDVPGGDRAAFERLTAAYEAGMRAVAA